MFQEERRGFVPQTPSGVEQVQHVEHVELEFDLPRGDRDRLADSCCGGVTPRFSTAVARQYLAAVPAKALGAPDECVETLSLPRDPLLLGSGRRIRTR